MTENPHTSANILSVEGEEKAGYAKLFVIRLIIQSPQLNFYSNSYSEEGERTGNNKYQVIRTAA